MQFPCLQLPCFHQCTFSHFFFGDRSCKSDTMKRKYFVANVLKKEELAKLRHRIVF
jgi:hypothetical protein